MLKHVKQTVKHSAIYGFGNVAAKLVGVVLLPLYTKHITVSEYGILGILEVTIMIMSATLIAGQAHAYLRFHDSEEYKERRKQTLFTIFSLILAIGVFVNLIGQPLAPKIASYFSEPEKFAIYFKLCFYIVLLRIINNLFLGVLRAEEKSVLYAVANILKIVVVLSFNVYFVAFAQIGVKGILYSFLIGDALLFALLIPQMIVRMKPNFDGEIVKASIWFGFPLVFTGLAGMLLNLGDRYLIKLLVNYHEVGLYDLGYRIAGLINVFLIQSFGLGFLPRAYKMYGQKGDKRYYSKMQTYLLFALLWAGLALSFFSRELVQTFALNSDFWPAYKVVPIITFAYVLAGARGVVNLGMFLKNRTKYLAYSTVIGLVLNVGLNLLLIPRFGMMGAAYATLVSFAAIYLVSYHFSKLAYAIPYENAKLAKLLILALALYVLSTATNELGFWLRSTTKIGLLVSFPFILYLMNFYERIELERIKEAARLLFNKVSS
jgi:O-antigen/teichoic acid export membrane protein